ncbi:hypothetical protein [Chitinophaga sp. Cy-1792]|uniref:hypothetical protein n=1 Tax=Chitinophaga sp. Cy-1792 TaxID=2608339 RepID=UPI00141F811E|nr:hypothetical protein [Chitinophaga sp. Cy-1792]NIG53915.1 hypothetical protein [Chitinophaga sp. Cy-1792]
MHQLKFGLLIFMCISNFTLHAQTGSIQDMPVIKEEIKFVQPIKWSRFRSMPAGTPQRVLMGKILLNTNKYALTTWWEKRGFAGIPFQQYLDLQGITEHKIRPVAAEAEALATSLKTGLYQPAYTGISVKEATDKTLQLIRSLAHAHLANTPNGWGKAWQSPLWAAYTAFAAWSMWDNLDAYTRSEVLAMINTECSWVMSNKGTPAIKTYRNKAGEIISPGDTGAEENAWDASILGVACAMMPALPQQTAWKEQLIRLSLNAMARPSDVASKELYTGITLSSWLTGSNINEDGTVVNHHFIHPDYMTSPYELNSTKFFWLAGLPVPKAFALNSDVLFHAFADLKFNANDSITGGRVQSPGGTIFKSGSGEIFYPIGTDWGQLRRMNFALFNCSATVFTNDSLVRNRASDWELRQAQVVLDMQHRFTDGHTYAGKQEDSYASCEEWVADASMTAYILESLKTLGKPVFAN